jgi:16S rRNA (cytidine1402-2'-O)-methyltransferase
MNEDGLNSGILYVVGTPIGNLQDMTLRAVQVLKSVALIAAEDTRHTGKLLHHFQITTPQISYHTHNRAARQSILIERLQAGDSIALVADAGMPGICDPGYDLVKACIEVGIKVVPIPGASAVVTALVVSGLPADKFVFEGFLPPKGKERRELLNNLAQETRTLIFYESPHRLLAALQDLARAFGAQRLIVLARELTKLHEQIWRGSLEGAIAYWQEHDPKGEFTLVVAGAKAQAITSLSPDQLKAELAHLLAQGMSKSEASRHLAQLERLPRRQLYQLAVDLEVESDG